MMPARTRRLEILLIASAGLLGCQFDSPTVELDTPADDPGLDPGPAPVGDPTEAWWDVAFEHRMKIKFDNRGRNQDLGHFPVIVALDPTRISYADIQDGGVDVRFVDADGSTVLDHEIERWDPAERSFVWVRVPRIDRDSDADYMYMYYGNPGAGPAMVSEGVWQPAGYLGVYHLSDSLTSNDDVIRDSSGLANDGLDGGNGGVLSASQLSPEGAVAQSVSFLDERDRVDIADDNLFAVDRGQARTMEVWFKAPQNDDRRYIWYKESGCRGWAIQLLDDGQLRGSFGTTATTSGRCDRNGFQYTDLQPSQNFRLDDDQWHYAVFIVDRIGGAARLYADGVLVASSQVDTGRFGVGSINAQIGHSFDDDNSFTGLIDETRISRGTRTDEWVAAQYAAVTGGLVQYDSPESLGATPGD